MIYFVFAIGFLLIAFFALLYLYVSAVTGKKFEQIKEHHPEADDYHTSCGYQQTQSSLSKCRCDPGGGCSCK